MVAAAAHCEFSCANMEVTLLVKKKKNGILANRHFRTLRLIGSSPKFAHFLGTWVLHSDKFSP